MASRPRDRYARGVEAERGPNGPPPQQDHGKTCLVATGLAVLFAAITAGVFASAPPTRTTDPMFYVSASMAGFAFVAGQGAAVTGFLAMKQKSNPLYVVPALFGGLLGVGAFLGLMAFSVSLGLHQAHPVFR